MAESPVAQALRDAADALADLPIDATVAISRHRAEALLIHMANRAEEDSDA